jgi:hypothetical protein
MATSSSQSGAYSLDVDVVVLPADWLLNKWLLDAHACHSHTAKGMSGAHSPATICMLH